MIFSFFFFCFRKQEVTIRAFSPLNKKLQLFRCLLKLFYSFVLDRATSTILLGGGLEAFTCSVQGTKWLRWWSKTLRLCAKRAAPSATSKGMPGMACTRVTALPNTLALLSVACQMLRPPEYPTAVTPPKFAGVSALLGYMSARGLLRFLQKTSSSLPSFQQRQHAAGRPEFVFPNREAEKQ